MASTTAERLARLETEMQQVLKAQEGFRADIKEINTKLDTLLELKSKGVGAFWLASALMGTGIVTIFFQFLDWFRGV